MARKLDRAVAVWHISGSRMLAAFASSLGCTHCQFCPTILVDCQQHGGLAVAVAVAARSPRHCVAVHVSTERCWVFVLLLQ